MIQDCGTQGLKRLASGLGQATRTRLIGLFF